MKELIVRCKDIMNQLGLIKRQRFILLNIILLFFLSITFGVIFRLGLIPSLIVGFLLSFCIVWIPIFIKYWEDDNHAKD